MNRHISKQSALLRLPECKPHWTHTMQTRTKIKMLQTAEDLYSSIQICHAGRQRMQDFMLNDIKSVPDIMHNNVISSAHDWMPRRQKYARRSNLDRMPRQAAPRTDAVTSRQPGTAGKNWTFYWKILTCPKFQQGRFVISVRRMQSSSIKFDINDTWRWMTSHDMNDVMWHLYTMSHMNILYIDYRQQCLYYTAT